MSRSGYKPSRRRNDDALARMDPLAFERLIGEHYRREGWAVEHCGTGGTGRKFDGGIDLKLRRGDQYLVVECKRWNAWQVPHNDVHELLGIMLTQGATGAIFVCSGEFTRAAREAAQRSGRIQLIDGVELRRMLGPALPVLPALAHAPAPSDAPPCPEPAIAPRPARTLPAVEWQRVGARQAVRRDTPGSSAAIVVAGIVVLLALGWQRCARTPEPVASPPSDVAAPAIRHTRPATAHVPSPARHVPTPAPAYVPAPRPTAAEVRESRRLADEAMKVIEAHTPEI